LSPVSSPLCRQSCREVDNVPRNVALC
jgi:hypothetical protein